MREVYEKVYRRTNFSFNQDGKEYTQRVINVTFKYSVKEFNKVTNNIYVKDGYILTNIHFDDNILIIDGQLVAIQVNTPVENPVPNDILGKYFYFESGTYKAKSNIKTTVGVAELRKQLYEDGFYCDGIKYVRYKRSSGSSRVGKCLFIDEKLYSRMHRWELCGLKIKEGQTIDLAALEAYISLTLSSIIGTTEINSDNILLIDDYESVFKEDVIAVDEYDGKLRAEKRRETIKNSIWDGQSLIDPSAMGNYSQYGFVLLRNRFFKSACFNCNIQKWFSENGITSVSQLNGVTRASKIENIKLITTPSSIKYLKFGTFEQWLNNLDSIFGVVKHEKPTHFFDGRMVQVHYQLLNSLQMSQEEVNEFLALSFEYINAIKTDPAVLRYHIKYPTDQEFEWTALNSKNDVIYKMLGINDKFAETKLYYDFKKDLIDSLVRNLRQGHVLVRGTYATMLGNPLEMLMQSIGIFDGKSQIGMGKIYCKKFDFNCKILGSRSPHVCSSNIWVTENQQNENIEMYFNLTDGIVCVNSINENLLNRLSGSDFDSDSLLLTNNKILLKAAKKNYKRFIVPVNCIMAKKIKRRYTANDKADLDIKTSVNKIGEIINLSQELNAQMWNKINAGESFKEVESLYYDIVKLDVLSGIEIDKAKKEFDVNSVLEIEDIKNLHSIEDNKGRKIKPNFFGAVAKSKGYYNIDRNNYSFHNTTMDFIQHTINQYMRNKVRSKRIEFTPFSDLLIPFDFNRKKVVYSQISRVITLVRGTNKEISKIYANDDLDTYEKYSLSSELRQQCINHIDQTKFNSYTMYWLLNMIESEQYRDIRRLLFSILFGAPNRTFFKLIKDSTHPIGTLVEDTYGKIQLYNYFYSIQTSLK